MVAHISDRVSIHQRPVEVEDRRVFGHFEMDLIQNGKDFILTITERMSRFLLMEELPNGKNADDVANAAIRLLKPHKKHLKSITTDNGGEFAKHKLISKKLKIPSFSPILIPPGRRERWKTQTNSSGNTYLNL